MTVKNSSYRSATTVHLLLLILPFSLPHPPPRPLYTCLASLVRLIIVSGMTMAAKLFYSPSANDAPASIIGWDT